jgi:hypothetical protein
MIASNRCRTPAPVSPAANGHAAPAAAQLVANASSVCSPP